MGGILCTYLFGKRLQKRGGKLMKLTTSAKYSYGFGALGKDLVCGVVGIYIMFYFHFQNQVAFKQLKLYHICTLLSIVNYTILVHFSK